MIARYFTVAVLAVLLLSGFGSCTKQPDVNLNVRPAVSGLGEVDERLLVPCPPLPTNVVIEDETSIPAAKAADNKLYADCAGKHSGLVTVIRKQQDREAKSKAEKENQQ